MNPPRINQIILFQFEKSDKWRIYRVKRETGLHISLLNNDLNLLGIYIPPKKLENGNVFLDFKLLDHYISFIKLLEKRGVKYYAKTYNETYFSYKQ